MRNLPGYVNYAETKKRKTDKSPEKFVEFLKPNGFHVTESIGKNSNSQKAHIADKDLPRQRCNGLDRSIDRAPENLNKFTNSEAQISHAESRGNVNRNVEETETIEERLIKYVDTEMQTSEMGSPAPSVSASEAPSECFEYQNVSMIKY